MSILKSMNLEGSAVGRYFFEYPEAENGVGHLITTYKTNGNPIPSLKENQFVGIWLMKSLMNGQIMYGKH